MATQTNAATDQKRTGPPESTFVLGVDQRGVHHVADADTATVHAVDPTDGRLARRRYQPGDDDLGLDGYVAGVAAAHGWARRRYGNTGDSIVAALSEVLDA